jgi:hypothetical protein
MDTYSYITPGFLLAMGAFLLIVVVLPTVAVAVARKRERRDAAMLNTERAVLRSEAISRHPAGKGLKGW